MRNQKQPIITITIAIINIMVFLVLSFGGMTEDGSYMLEHGAMYLPYFFEKREYYRIFTCMFLHFGISHLVNNMLTLFIMGRYLEPIVGKVRFILIYFLSGLGGNVLSVLAELSKDRFAVSAGASGAIFGLSGALLALAVLNKGQIAGITGRGMLLMIGFSLYNGFMSSSVDNFAHIGGLICGFLITLLLYIQRYAKRRTHTDF